MKRFHCLLLASAGLLSAQTDTESIRKILAARIEEHKRSVGIVVGVIDSSGKRVVSYGKRAAAFGDMVSLQVTMGLPLFAGARQEPAIEVRRQALVRVEAERAVMLREHQRDLEVDLAGYHALTRQLERLRTLRLPLARQAVDYQLASYRAGRGELRGVLQARRELIETRLRELELEAARAAAAAKLHYIYGEGAR